MTNVAPTSVTITVFTRHSEDCAKQGDPQWRRCQCRKSLYIREQGKTTYVSAKTRSWEQAERMAQEERDRRDPVKQKLQKIAEREAARDAIENMGLNTALDQWIEGMKGPAATSLVTYTATARKIKRWAEREQIVTVGEVTPAMLDRWRASWSPKAVHRENRIKPTTQAALLVRLKSFFTWATAMEYTHRNPTLMLKPITQDDSTTWPLLPKQFEELMEATYRYDEEAAGGERAKVGQHLRALFLVQRWTGLRVGDVLILPKAALEGNRLTAVIRKKRNRKPLKSRVEFMVPDHVVAALNELPKRKLIHPDYFFSSRGCAETVEVNKWLRKLDRLNQYLDFRDESNQPMRFTSHMLRDTFAVEMLLAGMPLEKVSKLLTHESVTITERYYAKWTKQRKLQLEEEAMTVMQQMGATFGAPRPSPGKVVMIA